MFTVPAFLAAVSISRFGEVVRKWLLAQDVLSRLEGREHDSGAYFRRNDIDQPNVVPRYGLRNRSREASSPERPPLR